MGTNAVINPVGLAVDDANATIVSAEVFGSNLGHRGFKTLADRRTTGNDLNKPFIIDKDFGAV